jgi:hypothetical protein
MIQCARLAFGYTGIFDEDEAQRIVEKDITNDAQVVREQKLEPTYYQDDEFAAKKTGWKEIVLGGKKDAAGLIAFVESKGKLFTAEQRVEIESWKVIEQDDPFLAEMNAAEQGEQ